MNVIVWHGAMALNLLLPMESYRCFLELDTVLQSDMVAYCIWDEVWICVQLATGGRGGRVFKVAKGISKKSGLRHREGWLWQGILR